jgi:hypothetical protein
MKKIILLLSAAFVSGFVFGLTRALHSVIVPNRYFSPECTGAKQVILTSEQREILKSLGYVLR